MTNTLIAFGLFIICFPAHLFEEIFGLLNVHFKRVEPKDNMLINMSWTLVTCRNAIYFETEEK